MPEPIPTAPPAEQLAAEQLAAEQPAAEHLAVEQPALEHLSLEQKAALLSGRDYVTPHDVKSLARDVLRHRLVVSYEADAEGLSADDLIGRVLDTIPVP